MIGPSGPLEKNLVIIFTLRPWNFWSKNATAKDKMVARPASPSPIVCAADTTWVSKVHHSQYSGIEQFCSSANSCSMLYRFPADLSVSSFKSHWSAIPHILLGTWYTGILELGLLDYFIHQTTWLSKILGPQYHMFYSTVTQVLPARPWGSQHSTVN